MKGRNTHVSSKLTGELFTVLHVDDDPNDSELLLAATVKARVPLKVHNVNGGEEAIQYLSGAGRYANRKRFAVPSLILLDLKMPRANGFDVLRWIRSHTDYRSTPVVMLSGSQHAEDMRAAFENGANSYLIKPLAFNALVELVKGLNSVWLRQSAAAP